MLKTVNTKYGICEGVASNAGFALFRGIPYAAPPVGDLRWRAPVDPAPWEGVRKCDTFGPACVQFDRWSTAIDDITDDTGHPYIMIPNYPYPPKMSEDCLYLNVYTPAKSADEKLPVMMYIHGGGLQQWYGSDYEYCGDNFCKENVILVTITYRLNIFGFYTHPELSLESGHDACGNYGIMDMIQALKWIRENIEAFGGDPENVTIFGQSGGARACSAIACSPLAGDYVAHASVQSGGGISGGMPSRSKEAMLKAGEEFMESLGCKSIAEMRALSSDELRIANDKLGMMRGFNLYADGFVLPKGIDEAILDASERNVDLIIGCTADEGANGRKRRFGGNMLASIYVLAQKRAEAGNKAPYVYVFDREQPGDDHPGVPHSCDNRYQFGSLDGSWRPYDEDDWTLSRKMTAYWANFARTGNPNGEGLNQWDPFGADRKIMRLAVPSCEMTGYDTNEELLEAEKAILQKIQ